VSLFLPISQMAGGLALFLFGMKIMSEGLRQAAGQGLRALLGSATRSRVRGVLFGTLLGFLAHSGPTVVMLVGFVNAGLMTLVQSFPVVMGANLGTTLSMQAFAFRIGDYCYAAVALGFALRLVAGTSRAGRIGDAVLGFGLLFLGMNLISAAVAPYKSELTPWLAHINGSTLAGLALGTAVALALTILVQSSGAVIGVCFALIHSGVFTSLGQVYPIVLGAHLGTCSTAWLAAAGSRSEAVRVAAGHQMFNVVNVLLGAAAMPWIVRAMEALTPDLLRQTANLHTALMLLAALVLLPVSPAFARAAGRLVPARRDEGEPSHLDPGLLPTPEDALRAATRELHRLLGHCHDSLVMDLKLLLNPGRKLARAIRRNEDIVNEIKPAMLHYLHALTRWDLTRRQAVCAQLLAQGVADVERVMDHLDHFRALCERRHRERNALFGEKLLNRFHTLHREAVELFAAAREGLSTGGPDFHALPDAMAGAFADYRLASTEARAFFMDQTGHYKVTPLAGLYYSEFIHCLDRLVRHLQVLVTRLGAPEFALKPESFGVRAPPAPPYRLPRRVRPDFFDHRR
jgi:phosphate:Na+ symporter